MKIKITIMTIMAMAVISSGVQAETLYFLDGSKVKAEVVEKGDLYIVVNENGRVKKYFTEQVERIEEDIVDIESIENIDMDKFAFTQESKVEWIVKLMDVNGTRNLMQQNINAVVQKAPMERKQEMRRIFDLDGVMEALIPIYDEHYTESEIRELVAFYETPTGQKMLEEAPAILKESMDTMMRYFGSRVKQ